MLSFTTRQEDEKIMAKDSAAAGSPEGGPRNQVILIGRVAAEAMERELPSGDTILTARVIVDRDPGQQSKSAQRVDTIDCVAWSARPQRTMRTWRPGESVYVEGAIRRRFYRGQTGPVSRVEVEVMRARRAKGYQ